jgi:PPP family 3-phenylpropionic acid transporter
VTGDLPIALNSPDAALRCWDLSSARALRAYYLASYASLGIFLPFASPWLASVGVGEFALGWIAATRPLAGIVAPVLFGWLADSFGLRGKILRAATLGAMLPFAWLAFRTMTGQLPSTLELWAAIGISSFFRVPMMTLADVSALEKTSGFGANRAFGSVGFMLSALAAGALLNTGSLSRFPIAVAVAFLVAYLLSFLFPAHATSPKRPSRAEVVALIGRPSFFTLLVTTALWAISHVAYDLIISLHFRDLGATPFGVSVGWALGAIGEIAVMLLWDRIKPRFELERWLLFGLIATTLRWLALSLVGSLPVVMLLQPLHALSFALVWIPLMELTRERAPAGLLATAQGMVSTSCSIGAAIGMVGFGAVYGAWKGQVTFAGAACVALVASAAFGLPSFSRARSARELEAAE